MSLTAERLKTIISKGENSKVDFKKSFSLTENFHKEEFVKDVSAIANTLGGSGFLIYGISDKKENVGISISSFKETQMQQIVAARCDPKITFHAYIVNYYNRRIGVVEIPYSHNRPHQAIGTGAFYIRRGSTTTTMSVQEIISALRLRMENERHELGEYDNFDPITRRNNIRKDVLSILKGINFKHVGIWHGDYYYHHGLKEYHNPDILENEAKRLRLFASIGNSPNIWDLSNWFCYIDNFHRDRDKILQTKHINVFLLIVYEPLTPKTVKDYHKFYLNTFIKIVPHTFYYGIGLVTKETIKEISSDRFEYRMNYWFPKFFLSRTRSKQDLESRLNLILDHTEGIKRPLIDLSRYWKKRLKKSH